MEENLLLILSAHFSFNPRCSMRKRYRGVRQREGGKREREKETDRVIKRHTDRERGRMQITEIKAHYPFSHFLFAYHM